MIPHRTGTAPSRRCPCPRRAEFDAVLPEQLLDTVRHVEIVIPRGTAAGPPTRGARFGLGGGFRWSNTPSPPCRFHRPRRQSPSGRPTRPGNAAMRTSSAMHWTICLAGPMTTVCRYLNMSLSKGTKEGVVAKRGGLNPDGDAESQFGELDAHNCRRRGVKPPWNSRVGIGNAICMAMAAVPAGMGNRERP